MALIICSWQFFHILIMLFISSVHLCFCQSNIETFYPLQIPSHSPTPKNQIPIFPPYSPSLSPSKQPLTQPKSAINSSSSTTIPKAVALTAASTLVFSALFFFLLRKFSAARRRRKSYYGGRGGSMAVVPHYESWPTKEFILLKQNYLASEGKVQEKMVNSNKDSTPAPKPPPLPPHPPPPPPVPAKKNTALSRKEVAVSSLKHPVREDKGTSSKQKQREDVEGRIATNGQVKLKPLHWDKLNIDTDHSMVWNNIDQGSFRYDGDLMEALFGCVATKRTPEESSHNSNVSAKVFILDTKKSQNAAIVLKSLGVTREEIMEALREGQGLDMDTLEKLAKITPTEEELSHLIGFDGDPARLAYAESFLYFLLRAISSAFTRVNGMLFKLNYDSEIVHFKECLETLESACKELQNQGLFIKLLEAILKAGNRLNAGTARGNAQGFNLSALRKLSDVKSIDGKTTLLHYVVQEVVRSEGRRCATLSHSSSSWNNVKSSEDYTYKNEREKDYIMLGLPVIGGLTSELSSVIKAASIDYDTFAGKCSVLTAQVSEVLQLVSRPSQDEDGFSISMKGFLKSASEELKDLKEEQVRVMELVTRTTLYYQAGYSKDKREHPFELFFIIKDFLGMVDQICIEIAQNSQRKKSKTPSSGNSSRTSVVFPKLPPNFFPDKHGRRSSGSRDDFK